MLRLVSGMSFQMVVISPRSLPPLIFAIWRRVLMPVLWLSGRNSGEYGRHTGGSVAGDCPLMCTVGRAVSCP